MEFPRSHEFLFFYVVVNVFNKEIPMCPLLTVYRYAVFAYSTSIVCALCTVNSEIFVKFNAATLSISTFEFQMDVKCNQIAAGKTYT